MVWSAAARHVAEVPGERCHAADRVARDRVGRRARRDAEVVEAVGQNVGEHHRIGRVQVVVTHLEHVVKDAVLGARGLLDARRLLGGLGDELDGQHRIRAARRSGVGRAAAVGELRDRRRRRVVEIVAYPPACVAGEVDGEGEAVAFGRRQIPDVEKPDRRVAGDRVGGHGGRVLRARRVARRHERDAALRVGAAARQHVRHAQVVALVGARVANGDGVGRAAAEERLRGDGLGHAERRRRARRVGGDQRDGQCGQNDGADDGQSQTRRAARAGASCGCW